MMRAEEKRSGGLAAHPVGAGCPEGTQLRRHLEPRHCARRQVQVFPLLAAGAALSPARAPAAGPQPSQRRVGVRRDREAFPVAPRRHGQRSPPLLGLGDEVRRRDAAAAARRRRRGGRRQGALEGQGGGQRSSGAGVQKRLRPARRHGHAAARAEALQELLFLRDELGVHRLQRGELEGGVAGGAEEGVVGRAQRDAGGPPAQHLPRQPVHGPLLRGRKVPCAVVLEGLPLAAALEEAPPEREFRHGRAVLRRHFLEAPVLGPAEHLGRQGAGVAVGR